MGEQRFYLKVHKIIIKNHEAIKCIKRLPTQILERGSCAKLHTVRGRAVTRYLSLKLGELVCAFLWLNLPSCKSMAAELEPRALCSPQTSLTNCKITFVLALLCTSHHPGQYEEQRMNNSLQGRDAVHCWAHGCWGPSGHDIALRPPRDGWMQQSVSQSTSIHISKRLLCLLPLAFLLQILLSWPYLQEWLSKWIMWNKVWRRLASSYRHWKPGTESLAQ